MEQGHEIVSEMRRDSELLAQAWYAACLSEELGKEHPIGRTILGERLVLWRGPGGRAQAMRDRCLHRNALLSRGEIVDGCLACPYHGWTYDTSGRCVHIPSEGPGEQPLPQDAALERFGVREDGGLIWVWMGPGGEPRGEPFEMPRWGDEGWQTYYMKTPFANNVTNCVENFMDVPHTAFVHQGWFRDPSQRAIEAVVERTPDSVLVTYDQPQDTIASIGGLLNPSGAPMTHTDRFYMPNNTRVDYAFGEDGPAFIITSTCTPVGPMETMVYTLISFRLSVTSPLKLRDRIGRLVLPWYTRRVIEQDVEILAIQGESLRHHGGPSFRSTPADTLHVHIEALRGWAASGGRRPRPAPVTERMTFWV